MDMTQQPRFQQVPGSLIDEARAARVGRALAPVIA